MIIRWRMMEIDNICPCTWCKLCRIIGWKEGLRIRSLVGQA